MLDRYKKSDETSYSLGTTLTIELLIKKPDKVKMVYVHSKAIRNNTFNQIEVLCRDNAIPLVENDKVFNKVSEKENCYVIGVFYKYIAAINNENNHLVLVNPSNSGNLGTILRSMVGFGLSDLAIIKPGSDVFDPKTLRASMGAFFNIRFSYYSTIDDYLQTISQREVFPFMLEARSCLGTFAYPEKYSLIFGNEATGLDDSFSAIGNPVRIAHHHTIDSLSLPIAVSIALYEFTKSKHID
ncbi:MAG: TrmH family RNA methyltransferase [Candidatus Izemoplasmatales bacterium]|nr:TrmH family RNA methyltransferase [Candidatus Izemoplasmatales bacterium]